jgi:large subunit ribosomal protein L31e
MQEEKDQQTELNEKEKEEPSNEEEEKKEQKEAEEDIEEEKFYTIPLSKAWLRPPNKRAPRAIKIIREFVKRHMKIRQINSGDEEEEKLVILNEVNEKIWSRGIEKPPRKIRVRVTKDKDGQICVYLA